VKLLCALLLLLQAAAPTPRFDANRAWDDLRQIVAIGPRPSGSAAIEATRHYIKTQLAAAGVPVVEQTWEDQTPAGPIRMVNLIATVPGASPDRLIIAGHYDTKRFRDISFVGASDGGSSAAFLLEFARALKGRKNPLTIELVFLDGEEAVVEWQGDDHTYGSRYYVNQAVRNGTARSIKGLILVDMIGARDLRIKRDLNSTRWMTDIIWQTAAGQQLTPSFRAESTMVDDDHVPFLTAGIPSVDLIDLEDYPAWHTALDDLDHVSARSLQIVGDVLLAALPTLESRLTATSR
jgi:Zn-dependent M28 family amino/carboxypeptidase